MSDVINGVPRELLERSAYLLELGELDGPTARELRALLTAQPQASARVIIPVAQIERAARKLADCMDYPWGSMTDQGRCTMMLHAQSILEAAKPEVAVDE